MVMAVFEHKPLLRENCGTQKSYYLRLFGMGGKFSAATRIFDKKAKTKTVDNLCF
jgi:hypothetical protein